MSKYAIITPTFEQHFKYVKKYLESYKKYVTDKEDITLLFTISRCEAESFKRITDEYCDCIKFQTYLFEDILEALGVKKTPDELLQRYNKFTFQTLKKFYTMLYSQYSKFLVLDSESMWVKETCMKNVFEEFFNAPFISGSSIKAKKTISPFTQGVIDNVNFLLGNNCDKWFLENFVWFYDKKILNDLFDKLGSPINLAEKVYQLENKQQIESGIFEIELYQAFLYFNLENYQYNFIDIDKVLSETLPQKELSNYINNYYSAFDGNCGLLEHSLMLLNNSNYALLADLFKKHRFNIIRCNYSDFNNVKLQEKFMDIVKPNILAASQEHAFGINDSYETLINKNKYSIKFEKHLNKLIHPKKITMQLLIEPFSIIYYGIKYCLRRNKNLKKYKRLYDSINEY